MESSFKEYFQLFVFQFLSLRPPPKMSLRHNHDWTRGKVPLVSTVDQQPEGKVVPQSRGEVQHATFSQLNQPVPKPICDRSGQPDNTQDMFVVKGETSRSHEINEKVFHGELCSSDRSGQPDITPSVIRAHNLSENIRVEQIHDRSGKPNERNSSSAHTVKENMLMKSFVKLRYSTRTTSSIVKSTRRTSISTFQDYHILL